MFVDFEKEEWLSNLKRQAKRLAKMLDIPLNQSQVLLSMYIYQERSFSDIKKKIETKNIEHRVFLAGVSSKCSEPLLIMFKCEFDELLMSFGNANIHNIYDGNIRLLILSIFDLNEIMIN